MPQTVLLTAAAEDTERLRSRLRERETELLHCPLERYLSLPDDTPVRDTMEQLEEFENIVYGSKRNARFFIEKVREYDKLEEVRGRLNLSLDRHTAGFLEKQGIPAVYPDTGGRAINLMEFMLRVRRMGDTLYPCGDQTGEELPGFLQELDIPVRELVLFTLGGPGESDLNRYREEIEAGEPDIIVFHSRRSVNRTLAAFPELDYSGKNVLSADRGVSGKLEKKEIDVTVEAEGSWESLLEKIGEML